VNLFEHAVKSFGTLDMVSANAGILELPENTFSDIYDANGKLVEPKYKTVAVNLIGVYNTVKLAIHFMRTQPNGGSIVATGSMASYGAVGVPVYTSTKHGVLGLMRSIKTHLIPLKIRLNMIAPGPTQSRLFPPDSKEKLESVNLILQTPDYPALGAIFLHQEESAHGLSICCNNRTYRELEQGYMKSSMVMYGDEYQGRKYLSAGGEHALKVFRSTQETIV
jgi:NAD(P)-dependent dehydrogenase (short-subunit alcohol dehydrogenase family)